MTITPEQFNKLVLKDDLKIILKDTLKEFEKRLPSKKQVEKLQKTMDSIALEYKNFDTEKTANLGAHNRLHENINEVRKKVGMETVEVI